MQSSSRAADPMSLSNIMSGTDHEPAATPSHYSPPAQEPRQSPKLSTGPPIHVKREANASPVPPQTPLYHPVSPPAKSPERTVTNGENLPDADTPIQTSQLRIIPDEEDVKAELARINDVELSDADDVGFESQRNEYSQRNVKRVLEVEDAEVIKRKVYFSSQAHVTSRDTN